MENIAIGDRVIGEGERCFIIAEAGVNHNGDIDIAKKLIIKAKECGADAVKFQTFKADDLVTVNANKAEYQIETTGSDETQYDMLRKLELSENNFKELASYAREVGIIFLSSPFDFHSVDVLEELDVPAFKLGSGEITNLPLLGYIAKKRRPIILSTGMSTLEEVAEAVDHIRKNGESRIILLHAVSNYPARIEDVNLRAMDILRARFRLNVGYSDHTQGIIISVAAAARGACVIEKHFTLNKDMVGPDHRASLTPDEFRDMVDKIRMVETALGTGEKVPVPSEESVKAVIRKSIVAKIDIPKGAVITKDMITIKRPGTGIKPKYFGEIIGKKAKVHIKKDKVIMWDMVE